MIGFTCRWLLALLSAGLFCAAVAGPLQDAETAYANADYAKAFRIWRELAEQGDASAQANLGRVYRDGRGVTADQAEAVKWLRRAAEQGHGGAQANLAFMYSNGQPPQVSTSIWQVIGIIMVESFRRERLREIWERKLAEAPDVATLERGLQWERSELAKRMRRLEREAALPERREEMMEVMRGLVSKGGRTADPRARDCAQADTLSDRTDTFAPFMEALTAGAIIASAQQAPAPHMDTIRRSVLTMRPVIREMTREAMLAMCLFAFKDLTDAEFDDWLQFLRSDVGGRYARAYNDARRDAMLDVREVFTRTMIEMARRLKTRNES